MALRRSAGESGMRDPRAGDGEVTMVLGSQMVEGTGNLYAQAISHLEVYP